MCTAARWAYIRHAAANARGTAPGTAMSAREASFQVVAPRGERRDWGGAHGRTKNKASFSNALKDLRDPANTASGRGAGSYQGREWDVAIRGILANIGYLRSRRSNNAALVGDPAGENSHATGYHNAWDEMYDPGQEDPHVWDRRFYGESYLTPVEPHLAASARGGAGAMRA